MKITKISSLLLKYMVECYHESGKDLFNYDVLSQIFPNIEKHELNNALYALKHDNLVKIKDYENIPYLITLKVEAIIQIEEDTLLKKGYDLLKK